MNDYRNRLGDDHPTVTTVYDMLIVAGVKTRDEAEATLDAMPPSYGTLTRDERAAVLDHFEKKRQCCCRCLRTVTEYTTKHEDDGRRWHYCTECGPYDS